MFLAAEGKKIASMFVLVYNLKKSVKSVNGI